MSDTITPAAEIPPAFPDMANVDLDKTRTVAALIRNGQAFIPVAEDAQTLFQEYWDVVGGEGLNADELGYLGVDAETVGSVVTLMENIGKFVQGEAVTQTMYRITLNQIRRLNMQGK